LLDVRALNRNWYRTNCLTLIPNTTRADPEYHARHPVRSAEREEVISAELVAFPNRRTESERQQARIGVGLIWEGIKAAISATPGLKENIPPHADGAELQALAVELGGVAKRIERALANH
jgi:hypothetical protein